MSPADVAAASAFLAIVVGGLIAAQLFNLVRHRPARRILQRVKAASGSEPLPRRPVDADKRHQLFSGEQGYGGDNAFLTWLSQHLQRVRAVSGPGGLRLIAVATLVSLALSIVATSVAGLPAWLRVLIDIGVPLATARAVYRMLIVRFRLRFLAVFPDAIDLMVRAVRAGIPVVHAIVTAGVESQEPVRSTFHTIGDGLRVGADLKEVLEQACERLQIADFSFFAVCLMLQRETGGSLTETLENLSGIIRARRDVRLKTKALTAEGKISAKIIAAVPFAIMGFLYLVNRPYIELLFDTGMGHTMLMLAAVLLTVGLLLIRKIANLDTSR
ncbi:type II secretion system F family protein (plasmid) [Burkholderia humptydooensis]|uniref:Type II secretion system F family protein n=2 Tax=Burkholderia humptydooensis TaxID=430531 RepID=A0A7U4SUA0_9BURK|nr:MULTISPECIES: type II secretion system F family protein [Burkholderia]AJY38167.1 type II secretion system (T2SS), F family protein [Burkholderia sp. 2002721687]ALX44581.1 pilus assembly protein [Burkholderia humptydooensis]EIP84999.1 pilus assembly protein, putative [Burkholderia humptydooensis MSMB43]QPS42034.1 type II secretion system F family protein [Burkholderia humptydooensis]